MSDSKKILRILYLLLAIIQIIILLILFIHYPLPEILRDLTSLIRNQIILIFIFFTLAIICYIFEHKKNNKNEGLIDDNLILPAFDISFKDNDILYLSTILNQKLPGKKEIILLIMQLINKKVIDLSSYYNGTTYQYIITKRTHYTAILTDIEKKLIDYLFYTCDRVDLIKKVKKIYSTKNVQVDSIVNDIHNSREIANLIRHSSIKAIYKILTAIISVLALFLGIILVLTVISSIIDQKFKSSIEIVITFFLIAFVCIFIAFIFTLVLKKLNSMYQDTNDTYSWILLNIIFFNMCLLFSYIFPYLLVVIQYFLMIIYIFTTLTIMIKYNTHISLSENDIIIRNRLVSLKKYFLNMQYLTDKEFAHIITYEECIMYGFLFNITIKINKEFDILQKELLDIIKSEGSLYLELFNNNI